MHTLTANTLLTKAGQQQHPPDELTAAPTPSWRTQSCKNTLLTNSEQPKHPPDELRAAPTPSWRRQCINSSDNIKCNLCTPWQPTPPWRRHHKGSTHLDRGLVFHCSTRMLPKSSLPAAANPSDDQRVGSFSYVVNTAIKRYTKS